MLLYQRLSLEFKHALVTRPLMLAPAPSWGPAYTPVSTHFRQYLLNARNNFHWSELNGVCLQVLQGRVLSERSVHGFQQGACIFVYLTLRVRGLEVVADHRVTQLRRRVRNVRERLGALELATRPVTELVHLCGKLAQLLPIFRNKLLAEQVNPLQVGHPLP